LALLLWAHLTHRLPLTAAALQKGVRTKPAGTTAALYSVIVMIISADFGGLHRPRSPALTIGVGFTMKRVLADSLQFVCGVAAAAGAFLMI